MDKWIFRVRYFLVTIIAAVIWLVFLPLTFFFETLALIIWFLTLFAFAVLGERDHLKESWINHYPVFPKVIRIGIKNMYIWSKDTDNKAEYINDKESEKGFVIVHAWIGGIVAVAIFLFFALVIISIFSVLGWWVIIPIVGLPILVFLSEQYDKKEREEYKKYQIKDHK